MKEKGCVSNDNYCHQMISVANDPIMNDLEIQYMIGLVCVCLLYHFEKFSDFWMNLMSLMSAGLVSAGEVDHQLVGGHHDGSVGYLSHQVCAQASVQSQHPLLPVYSGQGAPECGIFVASLSESRPCHLMRISYCCCHCFTDSTTHHHCQEVLNCFLIILSSLRLGPLALQLLIDHKM